MSDEKPGALGGMEKTAVLLLAMGPEFAAKTLKRMPEDRMHAVLHAMGKLKVISLSDQRRVLEEFHDACAGGQDEIVLEPQDIEKFVNETVGREAGRKLLSDMRDDDGFTALRQVPPRSLAGLLGEEHPQTVAVALSQFDSEKAAGVLEALPEALRLDVCRRIGHMRAVSRDVVIEVGRTLAQAFQLKPKDEKPAPPTGSELLADILSMLPEKTGGSLLGSLKEKDPELGRKVELGRIVFEDVVRLDNKAIQKMLGQVDQKSLGYALKGATQQITEKFFSNMTKESSEALLEDMGSLGEVKPADVDASRQKFVTAMSKMIKGGDAAFGAAAGGKAP